MENIIAIQIDPEKTGHKDLHFSFDNLTSGVFDTYYFALELEGENHVGSISRAVALLIEYWKEKTINASYGETVYLPIDFSDEYTGCLKVEKTDSELKIMYGFSSIPGYAVGPVNPDNYYRSVTDFEPESPREVIVQETTFIACLENVIIRLNHFEEQPVADLLSILISVKEKITDDSDLSWTSYGTPQELRDELNFYIHQLKKGDRQCLINLKSHFQPTSTFQEHSISNGWTDEYMELARRFDEIYGEMDRQQ